jgi:amino acid transporter
MHKVHKHIHRTRDKSLGVPELIAIALGGMVGGGIFTILGISVSMIGVYTPVAILIGGLLAALAAYSYVKLGVYYKDEGATYAFCKKVFPHSRFVPALIGWWVIFGYISTLALYAYTFAAYAISGFDIAQSEWLRKLVASSIILLFVAINLWSVKGMGKIEDLMVYTKLVILLIISGVLIHSGHKSLPNLLAQADSVSFGGILIVAAITFVAYEGFQLVINAVNEMEQPERNIPLAIYSAIGLAILIYLVLATGAILAIPFADIIRNKEYALAAGTHGVLGHWGTDLVIAGALLATSSAISGTVFGASRQMAVIASDKLFPAWLAQRHQQNHQLSPRQKPQQNQGGGIPSGAIIAMGICAIALIAAGSLQVILEFGSVTFLLVSLLIAVANYKVRALTCSSTIVTWLAMIGLGMGTLIIMFYEYRNQPEQLVFIAVIYAILTLGAWWFSRRAAAQINTVNHTG